MRLPQGDRQALKRPTGKRLAQRLRVAQCGRYHQSYLLAGVGRWTTKVRRISQSRQSALVEALDPCPHGRLTQVKRSSDGWHTPPVARLHDDAGSVHVTHRCVPGSDAWAAAVPHRSADG